MPAGSTKPTPTPINPELNMFLQMPRPRQFTPGISRKVWRKALFDALVFLLLGGIFTLVGSILSVVFFPRHLPTELALDFRPKAVAQGTVTSSTRTSWTENNHPVYKISYTFATSDGAEHQGFSFRTGSGYATGERVEIEYLPDRPSVSRIRGLRVNVIGYFILFVLIFPVIGLIFAIYAVARVLTQGRKNLKLLAEGDLAWGTVTTLTRTMTQINHQNVYRIDVTFEAGGNHIASYRTYGPDVDRATAWQKDQTPLRVLYDPQNPDFATVVETLIS